MSLSEFHPKVEEALSYDQHGTLIDGIVASSAIDTAGEMLDIKGCDINSLNSKEGVLNTEHIMPDTKQFIEAHDKDTKGFFGTIVGRCIFAKKIFSENDCESQRELMFWNSIQLPMIYGVFELYDSDGHENAKELAAIISHYSSRNLPSVASFSIEGNTTVRDGNHLLNTIARRVALTLRPANHSSVSGLVATAVDEPVSKSELVIKGDNFILSHSNNISPLIKTLTLGSYNTAPGSLSQGAALATDGISKKNKKDMLKAQILSAIRDWDKSESFKEFMKHRLPEVSEKFLDDFANMTDSIKLSKAEKVPEGGPSDAVGGLKPLPKATHGAIFRGKHIIPGEAEIVRGPLQGKKLKLFHADDNHVYTESLKSGGSEVPKPQRTLRSLEGTHYVINKMPETLPEPLHVDALKHGHPLNQTQEQKELIHGIDVSVPTQKPLTFQQSTGSFPISDKGIIGWYKSAHNKHGYVKPAVHYKGVDELNPKDEHFMPTAHRETVFHNMARDYFGLGQHVPVTSTFKHPETGVDHSVMEVVPGAQHFKEKGQKSLKQKFKQVGDNGTLHKLAIMDVILGNSDRNKFNYMLSHNQPNVHLIDNALSFQYGNNFLPHYIHDHSNMVDKPSHEMTMHPEAQGWMMGLDPVKLGQELTRNGIHPNLSNQAISRLMNMQSQRLDGFNKLHDILFSGNRFK